jgi:DNA-binding NarL/FixJ family response regulator
MKQSPSEPQVLLITQDANLATRLGRELERTGVTATHWHPESHPPSAPFGGYHLVLLDTDAIARDVGSTGSAKRVARGEPEGLDEIVAFVRDTSTGVIVLALADDPSKDLLIHLLEIGVDKFLQKPIGVFDLAAHVRDACHRSVISRFSAEIFSRLKNSESLIDRSQIELHDAIVRSNEELQTLNRRLYRVVSQLKTLYHMGRDLAENENWSDALDRFLMALVSFMGADGAALLLFSRNNSILAPRSSFQIDDDILAGACARLLSKWKQHTRSTEIHSFESYSGGKTSRAWRAPRNGG